MQGRIQRTELGRGPTPTAACDGADLWLPLVSSDSRNPQDLYFSGFNFCQYHPTPPFVCLSSARGHMTQPR